MTDFRIEHIGDKRICIGGVGKMFYQDGFPISMAVSAMKQQGVEVSILHVADECLKHGWSAKTTYNRLVADIDDDIDGNAFDVEQLRMFCFGTYEDQREMLFQYLFGSADVAKNWAAEINLIKM